MRLLFAGSPAIALPTLDALHPAFDVCGILTNPDRPSGRGRQSAETDVSLRARTLGIPLLKPERLDGEARDAVRRLSPELLVVVAYGRIFGPKFLGLFPKGAVNLHPSLLPKYRGPSPIPAAILAGDAQSGVTVQRLSLKMDAGDILLQKVIPLSGIETTQSLTEEAACIGAGMMVEVISNLDRLAGRPQDESAASYCRLVGKDDGRVDWRRSAVEIDRMVRAYFPWPEARTIFRGSGLQILEAVPVPAGLEPSVVVPAPPGSVVGVDNHLGILVQTGDGLLALRKLKLQSKKALNWKDFLNGVHDFIGSDLGG